MSVAMTHFISMGQKTSVPRSIVVYKTQEPIMVDGIAEEASWGNAMISDDFMDIEGVRIPTYRTNVRMLWDEEYLYFFAELEEPHVWATIDQRAVSYTTSPSPRDRQKSRMPSSA